MNNDFEQIRAGLNLLEMDTLKDALCLALLQKNNHEIAMPRRGKFDDLDQVSNFAELMLFLKRNFTFSELSLFSIDDGHVFVEAGNRKVELYRESKISSKQQEGKSSKNKSFVIPAEKSERFRNLELDE